ncbi:MAG: ATP-dependent helicase RecG, partial [Bacteroidota bacterium]
ARERISIMCATNDGFKIAEKDLEMRGPGDIEGTRQSGELNFKLASIVTDKALLEKAKEVAEWVVTNDEKLEKKEHECVRAFLQSQKNKIGWGKIS